MITLFQASPLMPKATAVWLVENTSLSFDQIAQLCSLHTLEVKAIADGDAAQGIKGLDPILTGQLTREEISAAEADPNYSLHIAEPKVRLASRPQPLQGFSTILAAAKVHMSSRSFQDNWTSECRVRITPE